MPKIAIILVKDIYYNYGDDVDTVMDSISEWTEVSEKDLKILERNLSHIPDGKNMHIIEWVETSRIPLIVSSCMEYAKKEEEKREQEKRKREEAKIQRELKKKAKTEEQEKLLLAELLARHGHDK